MKYKIDVPFGAHDSELKGWEYTIPEGMEAIIKDGKVVVREKESKDERIRKSLVDYFGRYYPKDKWDDEFSFEDVLSYLENLEKQKEQKPTSYSPLCNTIKDKIREYVADHFVTDAVVKTDVKSIIKAMEEGVRLGKEEQKEQKPEEWSEEDKKWLSEVYFAIDHSMYSEDERRAMKNYIDSLRKNRKTCDVDEFSLTLRNCLSADSELTKEQADTFARAYGEDLYKVALGEMESGADRYDIAEYKEAAKEDESK